jgi:hypothetical protein
MLTASVGLLTATLVRAEPATAPVTAHPLPEVTVIAQRLKLEARISNFVYGIAAQENYEGLARWKVALCPLVTGLPREQGEFVLERLSEITRTAGAPLAGEHCRPNLFIFVTDQPTQLLREMEHRYFARSFGNATPSQVDAFISTPRAVRVWHSPYWTTEAAPGLPASAQLLGGGLSGPPTSNGPGPIGPSRLKSFGVWTFGNVYVIADAAQMHGVSKGQFADYVAMVSLAEIKPAAHLGNNQSILSLFAGAPAAAPAGLSSWDQAFLKGLYNTAQNSTMQRSLITASMTRDLAPQ